MMSHSKESWPATVSPIAMTTEFIQGFINIRFKNRSVRINVSIKGFPNINEKNSLNEPETFNIPFWFQKIIY